MFGMDCCHLFGNCHILPPPPDNFSKFLQSAVCKFYNILPITFDNFVFLQAKPYTQKKESRPKARFLLFSVSSKQRPNPMPVEP